MRRGLPLTALLALLCAAAAPAAEGPRIPATAELAAHIRFLSDDLLAGRGVGTPGGRTAELYIESAFRAAGLAPAFGDSYRQEIALLRVTPDHAMTTRFSVGGAPIDAAFGPDIVGTFPLRANGAIDADLVYVGYGIVSDQWHWDDYKGVDVKGKVVLVHVGEPGRTDPALFEGPALTYSGRWTYKLEEAQRHGAIGVLLIHDTADAGYDWNVARNGWSGPAFFDGSRTDLLGFQGWISNDLARNVLARSGHDLAALRRQAETREFKPVTLGGRVRIAAHPAYDTVITSNVAGIVPGRAHATPARRAIVLSAHHDHLGTGEENGHAVTFNGAVDNGSALAILLGLARSYGERPPVIDADLVFLACAAEEEGMLGSLYFVQHPPVPVAQMVANVNFEMTSVWGEGNPLAIGARYSELDDTVHALASAHGLTVAPEPAPEQGYFYRSDQFSFARAGVPAMWLDVSDTGQRKAYREHDYHRPTDRFDPRWPLAGTRQVAGLAIEAIAAIDARGLALAFKPGSPFKR